MTEVKAQIFYLFNEAEVLLSMNVHTVTPEVHSSLKTVLSNVHSAYHHPHRIHKTSTGMDKRQKPIAVWLSCRLYHKISSQSTVQALVDSCLEHS